MVVGEERIGAILEQQVNNIIVALLRGPQDRSGNGISSFCVYVGALLDKVMAKCVVVVDRGPLDRDVSGRNFNIRE